MLVESRRGFRLGSSGARVVESIGPGKAGCSACEEMKGALSAGSSGPGRVADPGNAGTRLDCFLSESVLCVVPLVRRDERCGFRCGMAGGIPSSSSSRLNCSVRIETFMSCNGMPLAS
jgi:hypothetical protein